GRFVALVVVVGALAACTTGGGDHATATPSSSAAASATPVGPERFQPGEYRYGFNGVTASLSLDGATATLDVTNASGADLAAPGLYVIDGTGRREDATVAADTPVANGADGTFQVTFPADVTLKTIGLVILLFGDSNYGAMAPAPAA
ncbi:MAG: hypothetical protein ACXVQJ_09325, partial [Actinomycetota bacterium]